jgi:hypothetical protein
MPKHAKAALPPFYQPTPAEWQEGRRRVLALIHDLNSGPKARMSLDPEDLEGGPQENVVHPHLFGLSLSRNIGVQVAFASILTDWLGAIVSGEDGGDVRRRGKAPVPMTWPTTSSATIPLGPFSDKSNGGAGSLPISAVSECLEHMN